VRSSAASPGTPTPSGFYSSFAKIELESSLFESQCRFEGEPVAAAAAETPYLASDAVGAIQVDYEVLPGSWTNARPWARAPQVHGKGNTVGDPQRYERGSVEKGFAEADIVLHDLRHRLRDPHSHGTPRLRRRLGRGPADPVGIHAGCIRRPVRVARSSDASLQGARHRKLHGRRLWKQAQGGQHAVIAAILARMTGRPVKLFITREETYLAAGNRPPSHMKIKAGSRRTDPHGPGLFVPRDRRRLSRRWHRPVDWLVKDLYTCPNVRSEMTDVYINAGPARP